MGRSFGFASKTTRKRAIWVAAVTVVLSAGIILGVSMLSTSDDGSKDGTELGLTTAERSRSLYDDAITAVASGDTTAAVALLKQALEVDPDNADATRRLTELGREEPTSPDGSTVPGGGTPTGDPDASYQDAVADLALLLPTVVDGYDMSQPLVTEADAQVTGEGKRGTLAANVQSATFYVHDMGNVDDADSFVANQAHSAYPQNGTEISVNERAGYFGTDGNRIASVAFARGRFVFEVIVAARPGTRASTLLDVGIAAAQAFPAAD